MPDVIVKGGDYTIDQMIGAKEVMENGGRVVVNPIVAGFSTTNIIDQDKRDDLIVFINLYHSSC